MYSLETFDCSHKRVLVRVDFNVEKEFIGSDIEAFRLTLTKETVDHILSFPGSTITLITHYGRPEGTINKDYSVEFLIPYLEQLYDEKVTFTPDALDVDIFEDSRIALRENLRFYKEEESNDSAFAEKLAEGFDLYVNEAFSVSHRSHASVVAITEFIPSVAGFYLEREITTLTQALIAPEKPSVAVLGGAKIETKLPLIQKLPESYDIVLLGGLIANEAIDQNIQLNDNVVLPTDFQNPERLDIGEQTIEKYTQILSGAKTIIWNGPMGKFEEPPYDRGTKKILEAMIHSNAFIVAGGGESLSAIQEAGVLKDIDVISSGGGAMLDFLSGKMLPGITALQEEF